MCRWAAYIGAPIFLSDVILAPEHSLVAQSAHVRASTGATISRTNCHPFTAGRRSFMHNSQIGGFVEIRQTVEAFIRAHFTAERAEISPLFAQKHERSSIAS